MIVTATMLALGLMGAAFVNGVGLAQSRRHQGQARRAQAPRGRLATAGAGPGGFALAHGDQRVEAPAPAAVEFIDRHGLSLPDGLGQIPGLDAFPGTRGLGLNIEVEDLGG